MRPWYAFFLCVYLSPLLDSSPLCAHTKTTFPRLRICEDLMESTFDVAEPPELYPVDLPVLYNAGSNVRIVRLRRGYDMICPHQTQERVQMISWPCFFWVFFTRRGPTVREYRPQELFEKRAFSPELSNDMPLGFLSPSPFFEE